MITIYIQNTIEAAQKGLIQLSQEQVDDINTKGVLKTIEKSGIKYISIEEKAITATE